MPKRRIVRFYYRNGQIRFEQRQLNGQLHGLCCTWHRNGQIASESYYHHGHSHGRRRQWDENGRLLGSCILKHGTGRHCDWFDDGQLSSEADMLNGRFYGRLRSWMRDGTLVQEIFHIKNMAVSRAEYLKAAQKNPAWPQYKGEPAGKITQKGPALEKKEFELFFLSILKGSHAEAVQWLTNGKRPDLRSLAQFRTSAAALRFVKMLYDAGAKAVIAAPIYTSKRGKSFADWLMVKLPAAPSKRKIVRKLCQNLCDKRPVGMLPEKEMGESHLFLKLE